MQSAPQRPPLVRAPVRLPRGFVLEAYVIDGWLRDGGMASIYRAHRAQDQQRVAIKLQLPHTALDPEICARFDQEAAAMRQMASVPHIVELYDAGVLDDGRRYFAMEWLAGEDLEELLDVLRNRDQRLSVCEACRIGHEVATGLAALHTQELVHRDLKPANVMVAREDGGAVTLVDFGLVANLSEYRTGSSYRRAHHETLMGTSAYMPPEQLAGAGPEPTADVFALGVMLYEALTGNCVPSEGWTPENLPKLESIRRNIPVPLAQLVRSCMSSDAHLRPSSAADVADMLGRFAASVESANDGFAVSPGTSGRPGRTEVIPRPQAVVLEPLGARTGGTEVALTHDQARSISRCGRSIEEGIAPVEVYGRGEGPEVDEDPTTEHVSPQCERGEEAEAKPEARYAGADLEVEPEEEPEMATNPVFRPSSGAAIEDRMVAHRDSYRSSVPVDDHALESSSAATSADRPSRTAPGLVSVVDERAEASGVEPRSTPVSGPELETRIEPSAREWVEPRSTPMSGPERVARALDERQVSDRPRTAVDSTDGLRSSGPDPAGLSTSPCSSEGLSLESVAIRDFERTLIRQSRRRAWLAAGLMTAAVVVLGLWSLAAPDGRDEPRVVSPEPIVIVHSGERIAPPPMSPNPRIAASRPPADERSNKRSAAQGVPMSRASRRRARARKASRRAKCRQMREDATLAKQERNWLELLDHTEKRSCWAGSNENKLDRRRLRVEAYAETGDYASCVEEAGHELDPRVTDRVRWCKKRLEQEA